jgi:hypothetical protein
VKFSEEELSDFFVPDGETEEDQRVGEADEDLIEDDDQVQNAQ